MAAALGREVVPTREPGGTELGRLLRDAVLHGEHVDPRTEALLYATDRAHHVHTVVRPALERGAVVLTDRYLDSSVAYQGNGRDLGEDEVERLSLWAVHGLLPHLTVLLDLDPADGLARLTGAPDRLERAGDAFHRRTRDAFLRRAAADRTGRWLVLDAARPADDLRREMRARRRRGARRRARARRGERLGRRRRAGRRGRGAAARDRGPVRDDPRVAAHRAAGVGPVQRGPRLRGRAAVRARRLRHCQACTTALAGTHADVTVVATELVGIRIEETRSLVSLAQRSPSAGRWRVIVVEDADRMAERTPTSCSRRSRSRRRARSGCCARRARRTSW